MRTHACLEEMRPCHVTEFSLLSINWQNIQSNQSPSPPSQNIHTCIFSPAFNQSNPLKTHFLRWFSTHYILCIYLLSFLSFNPFFLRLLTKQWKHDTDTTSRTKNTEQQKPSHYHHHHINIICYLFQNWKQHIIPPTRSTTQHHQTIIYFFKVNFRF